MKSTVLSVLALLVLACTVAAFQPQGDARRIRVGVFDPQAVVVAYYWSGLHGSHHKETLAAHKAALDAGDKAKAREIERQAEALQDLGHQQLVGKAGIDNIVERTRSLMPGVAVAAKVDFIVIGTVIHPADAERVDVTEQYITALGATEATRKVIQELPDKNAKGKK